MLVLGASGFLGVHVVLAARARGVAVARGGRALAERAHADSTTRVAKSGLALAEEPPSASRRPSDGPRNPCDSLDAALDGARAAVVEVHVDFASTPRLMQALDRARPACVVNCAALSRISDCEREPLLARRVNADAPAEIARWCAANDARFVHASTDLVFGGEPPRASGYRDDDATDPRSTYGFTKRDGERAVLAANERALVVRLPLLYGESFGRGLGASDGLVAAIERGETPTLFSDEWRTPLDVAEAARKLVELAFGELRGLVHVAGAERLSRLELGLRVLHERRFADVEHLVRATTRAEASMSDRPRDVSLETSAGVVERPR